MRGTNWGRVAVAVWATVLAGLAVEAYLRPSGHTVFDIYAAAGRAWSGRADLYERLPGASDVFRYSPLFAALIAPLTVLPDGVANAAWKVLNAGVFLLGLGAWCRRGLPAAPLGPGRTGLVFLLALPVAVGSLFNGQANLLVAGLVLLAATTAAEGRTWASAAALAAATLVKGYPVVLALLLVARHPRGLAARYPAALAVGLAAPFLFGPPGYVTAQTTGWAEHMAASSTLAAAKVNTLKRLLAVAGAPLPPPAFLALAAVAAAGVLGITLRAANPRAGAATATAGFVLWVLLFVPSTETQTYALAAPVAAAAFAGGFGRAPGRVGRAVLLASAYLMGLATTDITPKPLRDLARRYAAPPAGALLLAGWLAADAARRRSGRPPEPGSTEDHLPAARAA
jgi:hypothetical protein